MAERVRSSGMAAPRPLQPLPHSAIAASLGLLATGGKAAQQMLLRGLGLLGGGSWQQPGGQGRRSGSDDAGAGARAGGSAGAEIPPDPAVRAKDLKGEIQALLDLRDIGGGRGDGAVLLDGTADVTGAMQASVTQVQYVLQVDGATALSRLVAHNFDVDAAIRSGMAAPGQERHPSSLAAADTPSGLQAATGAAPSSAQAAEPPKAPADEAAFTASTSTASAISRCPVCFDDIPGNGRSTVQSAISCGHGTCDTWWAWAGMTGACSPSLSCGCHYLFL